MLQHWFQIILFGSTLGKMAVGVVVIDKDSRVQSSRFTLLLRETIFYIFSAVPIVNMLSLVAGICCCSQFFHDSVAGTMVAVRKTKRKGDEQHARNH